MGVVLQFTAMPKIYKPEAWTNRIREQRERRGLTLQALAERSGYTPSEISRFERGERSIKLHDLERLAKALGNCDVGALIRKEDNRLGLSRDDYRVVERLQEGDPVVNRYLVGVADVSHAFGAQPAAPPPDRDAG